MEPNTDMNPSGTTAAAPAMVSALLADDATEAPAAPADGYVDLDLGPELEGVGAAVEATDSSPPDGPGADGAAAPAVRAIPEIPKAPPPPPFAKQVALLATVVVAVGAIAIAFAHPPAPPPALPAPALGTLVAPRADPVPLAPEAAVVPAPTVERATSTRARPIRRVRAPVEIVPAGTPGTSQSGAATPVPVSAPVLEGADADQSISEPPLTGT